MDTDVYRLIGISCALFFSCSVCSTIPPPPTPTFVILTALGTVPQSQQNKICIFVCSQHLLFFFFFAHVQKRAQQDDLIKSVLAKNTVLETLERVLT